MKLTCALIVAMLFLTACQLTTTDDSRGRQKYPTERLRVKMRNPKLSKLTKTCDPPGDSCSRWYNHCCSKLCTSRNSGPTCSRP
uniref:Conotoxin LiCr95 n=2 Tax=Conus TaxID=6490 RepID=O165_CONLI